ncbi:hypothetical protein IMG5_156100, partial [Ichthyophthirius multifiliis]
MEPQKARFQRKRQRATDFQYKKFQDEYDDDEEECQQIKKRINYFGYIIEPLNMKSEREKGEIDEDGNLRLKGGE